MPQMAPINWLSLFTMFSMIFLIFYIFNYFNFFIYSSTKNLNKINFFSNKSLTWKW